MSATAGILLTVTELVGDVSLKTYASTNNSMFLGIGTAAYLGIVYILQYYLKTESLAIINGYWDGFSNLVTTAAALAMGEKITNVQLAGLFIIGGGVYLL